MFTFALDRNSEEPLYVQLKRHLIRQIENGVLLPGDRLPATRDLAQQLGIARISVVAAYDELKAEGHISAHTGKGTFVQQRDTDRDNTPRTVLAGTARSQSPVLRDLLRMADRPNIINFSSSTPADVFLPVTLVRSVINTVLERDGGSALAYEAPEGYLPLRHSIAQMVGSYGIETDASQVLITGGCQQALDLAVQALLNPGDVLLTSNPAYAGILDIARARSVVPVGVQVDRRGMQIDSLEALLIEQRPRLIYVAPTYHNPTGTVMPVGRRNRLLELASRYRVPILEDGVYEDITYRDNPPPPLKALDNSDLVLYASSFSKLLLPGMRIGYLLAGERLYQRISRVKAAADICTPSLNQRVVQLALESGQFTEHLNRVHGNFQLRRQAILEAVSEHLPFVRYHEPSGGLYLWLELPADGPTAVELYMHTLQFGAAFAPGPLFYTDESGTYHLRLNMLAHPPEVSQQGVERIAQAWSALIENYRATTMQRSTPVL